VRLDRKKTKKKKRWVERARMNNHVQKLIKRYVEPLSGKLRSSVFSCSGPDG
jgi:hypothetical protein